MPFNQVPPTISAEEVEDKEDTWLNSMRSLPLYGELVRNLIHRDLKVKYGGSSVGVLISLIAPVVMLLVYGFAGRHFLHIEKDNFALYLIPAVLTWTWFASALAHCSRSVESQWYLLLNCHFPRIVLPLASIGSLFVSTMPSAVLFALLFFPLGGHLWWGLLLSPVFLALQWILLFGLVLGIAALQVFYRDLASMTQVLVGLLFWFTPVVFDVESIPTKVRPILLCLNPMFSFVTIQRQLNYSQCLPDPRVASAALLWSVAALASGMALFRKLEHRFCGEL